MDRQKAKASPQAKPFLKWAGGKKSLLPKLLKYVPKQYNRYFEPFFGGGSLFFALQPRDAFLSDLNGDLLNTYMQIKNNPDKVIASIKNMKYSKKNYYKIRAFTPKSKILRAARFIYLNRTCWNGLYRENMRGNFNVPFGKHKKPKIIDEHNIYKVSQLLKNARLASSDFGAVSRLARGGDLIYFDPPYVTSHNNNGFIKYNSKFFSLVDQLRLYVCVKMLSDKGCKIMVSNADHRFIRLVYKGYNIYRVKRKSLISANPKHRKQISELIITNY